MSVNTAVAFAPGPGDALGVFVAVLVGVAVGVAVGVFVGVLVGVGVAVGVLVGVKTAVALPPGPGELDGVDVGVKVSVGVRVGQARKLMPVLPETFVQAVWPSQAQLNVAPPVPVMSLIDQLCIVSVPLASLMVAAVPLVSLLKLICVPLDESSVSEVTVSVLPAVIDRWVPRASLSSASVPRAPLARQILKYPVLLKKILLIVVAPLKLTWVALLAPIPVPVVSVKVRLPVFDEMVVLAPKMKAVPPAAPESLPVSVIVEAPGVRVQVAPLEQLLAVRYFAVTACPLVRKVEFALAPIEMPLVVVRSFCSDNVPRGMIITAPMVAPPGSKDMVCPPPVSNFSEPAPEIVNPETSVVVVSSTPKTLLPSVSDCPPLIEITGLLVSAALVASICAALAAVSTVRVCDPVVNDPPFRKMCV